MIKKYLTRIIINSALSTLLILPSVCFANELVIKDTAGFTRAVSPVDEFGSVEFNVVGANGGPVDGVEVLLTNTTTGETLSSVSANGTTLFEGIEAGTWTVASTAPEVTFTGVQISSAAALGGAGLAGAGSAFAGLGGGASATAAAVGVGAVGVGAVAVAESNDKDDDSNNGLSPFQ